MPRPAHFLYLVTVIFVDGYKLWSSSVCNFLQLSVFFMFWFQKLSSAIGFPKFSVLCSSVGWNTILHHTNRPVSKIWKKQRNHASDIFSRALEFWIVKWQSSHMKEWTQFKGQRDQCYISILTATCGVIQNIIKNAVVRYHLFVGSIIRFNFNVMTNYNTNFIFLSSLTSNSQ